MKVTGIPANNMLVAAVLLTVAPNATLTGVKTPAYAELKVKGHPRLLFSDADLPALRAKAKDEDKGQMGFSASQIWLRVLSSAEVSARNPIPPQPYTTKPGTRYPWTGICFKVRDNLTPLAVAAGIVEDAQTASRLKAALKQSLFNLCRWEKWGDASSTSYILTAASLAYDVLYNDLTDAEQKEALRRW